MKKATKIILVISVLSLVAILSGWQQDRQRTNKVTSETEPKRATLVEESESAYEAHTKGKTKSKSRAKSKARLKKEVQKRILAAFQELDNDPRGHVRVTTHSVMLNDLFMSFSDKEALAAYEVFEEKWKSYNQKYRSMPSKTWFSDNRSQYRAHSRFIYALRYKIHEMGAEARSTILAKSAKEKNADPLWAYNYYFNGIGSSGRSLHNPGIRVNTWSNKRADKWLARLVSEGKIDPSEHWDAEKGAVIIKSTWHHSEEEYSANPPPVIKRVSLREQSRILMKKSEDEARVNAVNIKASKDAARIKAARRRR